MPNLPDRTARKIKKRKMRHLVTLDDLSNFEIEQIFRLAAGMQLATGDMGRDLPK